MGADGGPRGNEGKDVVFCRGDIEAEGLEGEFTLEGPVVRNPPGVSSVCARRVAVARRAAASLPPIAGAEGT